jgi:hypothetical protein
MVVSATTYLYRVGKPVSCTEFEIFVLAFDRLSELIFGTFVWASGGL